MKLASPLNFLSFLTDEVMLLKLRPEKPSSNANSHPFWYEMAITSASLPFDYEVNEIMDVH